MSRGKIQQERRNERAKVVSDETIWHMVFVAVVSYFDVQDGHIADREWTDRTYAAMDINSVRTGVTDSMRARAVWNFTHNYLSKHAH